MESSKTISTAIAVLSAMGVLGQAKIASASTPADNQTNLQKSNLSITQITVDLQGATNLSTPVKGRINVADDKTRCPADGNC